MARGKKGKTAKHAKEGDDVADAVPPTDVSSQRLQLCSEEIRVSFNFIQRFIREVEEDPPGPTRQDLTIPYDDVVREQQLCAGLLEQNNSIAMDSEAEALHPQRTALKELARAKREHTDAVLKPSEVRALKQNVGTFPRNITISYESLGKGQKGHCLRLMTSAEKKAILKGPEPVIETVGHVKLKANSATRAGAELGELDELLKDPRSFRADINKYIGRFTPSARATMESTPTCLLSIPYGVRELETHYFEQGDPLQKPVVDQEALMTEDEWRNEAKILYNTVMQHREIIEKSAKQVFHYVPGFTAEVDAEELFDLISEGIHDLSMKKDALAAENKDLHLAIVKKCNEKHNTDAFCRGCHAVVP